MRDSLWGSHLCLFQLSLSLDPLVAHIPRHCGSFLQDSLPNCVLSDEVRNISTNYCGYSSWFAFNRTIELIRFLTSLRYYSISFHVFPSYYNHFYVYLLLFTSFYILHFFLVLHTQKRRKRHREQVNVKMIGRTWNRF